MFFMIEKFICIVIKNKIATKKVILHGNKY
jgi:hypothetical protein